VFFKGFTDMSDEELKLAAVALEAHAQDTGDELYRRLSDEATDERARRMGAAPAFEQTEGP
jgi:hypothetical protein